MSARPNMTLAKWRDAYDRKCAEMDALDKRRVGQIVEIQDKLYELRTASEWQPIETADKGRNAKRTDDPQWREPPRLLAWSKSRGLMIVYWDWYYAPGGNGHEADYSAWVDASGDDGGSIHNEDAPTLWLPLPAPPVSRIRGQQ